VDIVQCTLKSYNSNNGENTSGFQGGTLREGVVLYHSCSHEPLEKHHQSLKGQSYEKVGGFQIFLIGPFIPVSFKVLILLNKTTSQLEGPCFLPDGNLFMLIS
jgi:hypothetical protein